MDDISLVSGNSFSCTGMKVSRTFYNVVIYCIFLVSINYLRVKIDYITANCSLRISETNMWPGLWVIHRGGFADNTARVDVTPQAQKTGVSPALMVTGSPKSGLDKSGMPRIFSSPI